MDKKGMVNDGTVAKNATPVGTRKNPHDDEKASENPPNCVGNNIIPVIINETTLKDGDHLLAAVLVA